MAIKDSKDKIFGSISSLKTLNDGYPKFNISNSIGSINNKNNPSDFLIDIILTLIGAQELRKIVINYLLNELTDVEAKIKTCLKCTLSDMNLGGDPNIPDFMLNGFNVKISDIDFFDRFKTDPQSIGGSLLYRDNMNGLNSADFNTFLYELLQDSNSGTWGSQVSYQDILEITFIDNNTINIKPGSNYNGKLSILNNDLIDSIKLFDISKMINNLIDSIFGSIAGLLGKSNETLFKEAQISDIIENLINAEDDVIIDDSYFTFTNEQIRNQESKANKQSKGVAILVDCNNYETSISPESLVNLSTNIENTSTYNEIKTVITNGLDDLSDIASENSSSEDSSNVKTSFFRGMLKGLINSLVNATLTPPYIALFIANNRIYDPTANDMDAIKFIKDNSLLVKNIVDTCKEGLLNLLLEKVLKEITLLVAKQVVNKQKETSKYKLLSTLSLVSGGQISSLI